MTKASEDSPFDTITESEIRDIFETTDYVGDTELVVAVLMALRLRKPLLIEGEPGAGKTELAKVLAEGFDTDLVRLQCYEGLSAEKTLYEWNYTKQLLAVQSGERGVEENDSVFSEEYLHERPLLRSLQTRGETPPVLLIDEVDRADEEFEALLLEMLSDYQITIPELGTFSADTPPVVIITSNRTRGLSDALKRRCLYIHIQPPSFEKELEVVRRKVPELDTAIAAQACGVTRKLRELPLLKQPGVAETLDWGRTLAELGTDETNELTETDIRNTAGCLLKEVEDMERLNEFLPELVDAAHDASFDDD